MPRLSELYEPYVYFVNLFSVSRYDKAFSSLLSMLG